MNLVHLTASRFFGGVEWQILEVAQHLSAQKHHVRMLSFSEGGRCWEFLNAAQRVGIDAIALEHDTPHLWSALKELTRLLDRWHVDVLFCNGYKADLLGHLATRRLRIPAISVSHGWTGENLKVRLYEALDRRVLRWMDHVVCVSEAQARKVHKAGVVLERITTIHNAVRSDRFANCDPLGRQRLEQLFPRPPQRIVGVAGRLSPEKGFDVLLRAAVELARDHREIGVVWFGDGPLRQRATRQIEAMGLSETLVLAGFCNDLDRLMPHFDLLVLPSYTEGLPCVVLEALAAAVPVVATRVGGVPEVVEDGRSGYLVAPGDASTLARRIVDTMRSEECRAAMGEHGRRRVQLEFTFETQAAAYNRLFAALSSRWPRLQRAGDVSATLCPPRQC